MRIVVPEGQQVTIVGGNDVNIEHLKKQNQTLGEAQAGFEKEIGDLKESNENKRKRIKRLEESRDSLAQQLQKFHDAGYRYDVATQAIVNDGEALLKSIDQTKASLHDTVLKWIKKFEEAELHPAEERLKEQADLIYGARVGAGDIITQLNTQRDEANEKVRQRDETITSLQDQVKELERKLGLHRETCDERAQQIENLKQLLGYDPAVEDPPADKPHELTIQCLQLDKTRLRRERDKLKDERDQSIADLKQANTSLEDLHKQVITLEANLNYEEKRRKVEEHKVRLLEEEDSEQIKELKRCLDNAAAERDTQIGRAHV